ncbi:MAG: DUF2384 domain-containing protein [Gemmatimonadetes bacterium]|nr:DUF2384 domain-containing protein [Gemmatimonadota bacterium]
MATHAIAATESLAYARRIGVRVRTKLALIEKVEAGLPYGAFEKLRDRIDVPAHSLAEVVRISDRTLHRRKERGRLEADESDRVLRIARLTERIVELFEGDLREARRWLTSPRRALDGKAPLDFARTEVGAREVEQLVERLEEGVFA